MQKMKKQIEKGKYNWYEQKTNDVGIWVKNDVGWPFETDLSSMNNSFMMFYR